jgi:divalent metal cation (Fe/Co/Zn/Cd) transporter
MRRALDQLFAALVLAFMMLVSIAFWGPIPAGWLWIGGQVKHQTGSGGLAISVSCFGLLLTMLSGLVVLKHVDEFWILVRRAAGYDQRTGTIGSVFALAAVTGVTLFVTWFLLLAGPGPELVGGGR